MSSPTPPPEPHLERLLAKFRALPAQRQAQALNFIDFLIWRETNRASLQYPDPSHFPNHPTEA